MSDIVTRIVHDTATGEIRDGERRYILMRPDVLMGILHGLDETTRHRVLNALTASAEKHGGRSVQAYADTNGIIDLLDIMCNTSAGLGWGRWEMISDAEGLRLTVHNSPFAKGYGAAAHTVCAPIVGIFQSLATTFFKVPAIAEELTCAAMAPHQNCQFFARRAPCVPQSNSL